MFNYLYIILSFAFLFGCSESEENNVEVTRNHLNLHIEFLNKGICGDVLDEMKIELDTNLFQFVSCNPDTSSTQVYYRANYKVEGSNAKEAEAFLMKAYEMDSLQFVCCGWEDNTGKYIDFGEEEIYGKVISFLGRFHSEETLINDRSKWRDIPFFYLVVKVAEV